MCQQLLLMQLPPFAVVAVAPIWLREDLLLTERRRLINATAAAAEEAVLPLPIMRWLLKMTTSRLRWLSWRSWRAELETEKEKATDSVAPLIARAERGLCLTEFWLRNAPASGSNKNDVPDYTHTHTHTRWATTKSWRHASIRVGKQARAADPNPDVDMNVFRSRWCLRAFQVPHIVAVIIKDIFNYILVGT